MGEEWWGDMVKVMTCAYENPEKKKVGEEKRTRELTTTDGGARESREYWRNYDLTKSTAPNLIDPATARAARGIVAAWRVHMAVRMVMKLKKASDAVVLDRMAKLIEGAWRRYAAQRKTQVARDTLHKAEASLREYQKFRHTLLGKGFRVKRWSHSRKALVPCTVRMDWAVSNFVFEQNAFKKKTYDIGNIQSVAVNDASDFVRTYVQPRAYDKCLSIFFRDKAKTVSVDLVFEDLLNSKTVEMTEGRVRRALFYSGFRKVIRELDSDEAFYYSSTGSYCRVNKSVFERWERITMLDPGFDPKATTKTHENNDAGFDDDMVDAPLSADPSSTFVRGGGGDTKNSARFDDADPRGFSPPPTLSRRGRRKSQLENPGCFAPYPLDDDAKPQNFQKPVYGGAATWFSETELVDFGRHAKGAHSPWFRNPMRKEIFTLQRLDDRGLPEFESSSSSSSSSLAQQQQQQKGHQPRPATAADLLPYFQKALKHLYGYTGVVGWRNAETGQFEFDELEWRKLCDIAIDTVATNEARKYAKALCRELDLGKGKIHSDARHFSDDARSSDDEPPASSESRLFSPTSLSPRSDNSLASPRSNMLSETFSIASADENPAGAPGDEVVEHIRNLRRQSLLNHLQKRLLMAMYPADKRQVGRMWHASRITYNAAQKKRYLDARAKAEADAVAERDRRRKLQEKHEAAVRRATTLYDERPTEDHGHHDIGDHFIDHLENNTHSAAAADTNINKDPDGRDDGLYKRTRIVPPVLPEHDHDDDKADLETPSSRKTQQAHNISRLPPPTPQTPRRVWRNLAAKGCLVTVVVLESSLSRFIPLGLRGTYYDLTTSPIQHQAKKRHRAYVCKHLFCLDALDLDPEPTPSIALAWETDIICKGDMLAVIDDVLPTSADDINRLLQACSKPRKLTFYRPDKAFLAAIQSTNFGTDMHV